MERLRGEVDQAREETRNSQREMNELLVELREANENLVKATCRAQTLAEAADHARLLVTRTAHFDFLTDLPNRMLLHDRIEQAILLARQLRQSVAILFLDIDRFKLINDSLGHAIGDKLLQSIAKRLVACVRECDTVFRLGGDEFVVLLSGFEHPEHASLLAKRALGAISVPHRIGRRNFFVTASIGISMFPDDGRELAMLMRNADTAMYQAKDAGRNNFQFFKPPMNTRAVQQQSIQTALHGALAREEFVLHFQPKMDLRSGLITGAEALIRWQHPSDGLIGPDTFIPVAEECGLIVQIGQWVLRQACLHLREWQDRGLTCASMAVNVSALEFQNENFLSHLSQVLRDTSVKPASLELELTEGTLLLAADSTMAMLNRIRAMGISLSVDDFGTGYSNLNYLRRIPLHALKIDKSFVQEIGSNVDDAAIVRAVIGMGRSLHLRVVAEGVETLQQLAFLRALDCDEAQGFLFGQPMPAEQFADQLETGIHFPETN